MTAPPTHEIRAWFLAHPRATPTRAAVALGIAVSTARGWRHRLIQAGHLPRLRHNRIDVTRAQELIADGLLAREVAARLGTRATTVVSALGRRDLTVTAIRDEHTYSAEQLAAVFGVSGNTMSRWLYQWRDAGLIAARRADRRTSRWRVTHDALIAFLDRPDAACWRARVVDPEWRAYLDEALVTPPAPIQPREIKHWFGKGASS